METPIENTAAPSVEVPRLVRLRCPKCGKSGECWLDKDDPPWSHAETAEIRTACFDCLGGERKPLTYHREDGSDIYEPNVPDQSTASTKS